MTFCRPGVILITARVTEYLKIGVELGHCTRSPAVPVAGVLWTIAYEMELDEDVGARSREQLEDGVAE